MVMSSQVQPLSRITLARPGIRSPPGNTPAASTPLLRVTGITVESGLTATAARTSGVNSPTSSLSWVARTEPISFRPSVVTAEIRPG